MPQQELSNQGDRSGRAPSPATPPSGDRQAITIQLSASETELQLLANEDRLVYLLIDISADPSLTLSAPRLNLGLVVDRSTSMGGPRIGQVKKALNLVIDDLTDQDAVSLVTFSDRAEVVFPAGPITNPVLLRSKVGQVLTGGGTEILQGLAQALLEMVKSQSSSDINHLFLLTDGHTYGDEDECIALVNEAAKRGIEVTAFGIGHSWNDVFLDALTAPSAGAAVYLESPEQIVRYLREHIDALYRTFAKDVKLWIELPGRVSIRAVHRLSPFPVPIPSEARVMPLGNLQYNEPISVLVELVLRPQVTRRPIRLQIGASAKIISRGRETERFYRGLEIKSVENPSPANPPPAVIRAARKVNLYRMSEQARQEAEMGETERASQRMERLGAQLLGDGHSALAEAAFREAENVARTGRLSAEGHKQLKYGTRTLANDHLP